MCVKELELSLGGGDCVCWALFPPPFHSIHTSQEQIFLVQHPLPRMDTLETNQHQKRLLSLWFCSMAKGLKTGTRTVTNCCLLVGVLYLLLSTRLPLSNLKIMVPCSNEILQPTSITLYCCSRLWRVKVLLHGTWQQHDCWSGNLCTKESVFLKFL